MTYVPKKSPPLVLDAESLTNFGSYVEQEFGAIGRELGEMLTVELRVSYAAPLRPRIGMLVYADGTTWNPGSGEGLYVYKSGGWTFVV